MVWECDYISWTGNVTISVGLGMWLYQLDWECGYISWTGNEAISVGLGMWLYQLDWE